ncbi:rhomboid family intramembrane serine protease [Haloprofundus salilacus]|uniref:rhomboid family intramembrane serine protease n=1 Tax=Haloprofundus salilacus TaxID=2876190 RepID=UPI001CCD71A1|nr:rhomboid family intramembrane serine protease [Haloprofundus salilacus]
MFAVPPWLPLSQLALVAVAAVCLFVAWRLDDRRAQRVVALRSRLLYGVPWGTLVSTLFVLAVYLFVQGGFDYWYRPVVVPFRAWSYLYPTGILTAAFSHSGAGHLIGNLVGTLTLAPLVEYTWGHYPRSGRETALSDWGSDPRVRAFLVFPAAVGVVGVLTALFSVGPIIGFSGVVFAFAGFALVYYPLTTVLALSASSVVDLLYDSLFDPTTVASSREAFVSPWWAQIAIQGHAIGLLTGALLALWLVERRGDDRPAALRLWTGVLFFSVSQSLWAVYWYRGADSYVLYRAAGLALVFLLATLVTAAASAGDRPLFDQVGASVRDRTADILGDGSGRRLRNGGDGEAGSGGRGRGGLRAVTGRQVAVALLLVGAASITGPAVAVNMVTTAGEELPGESVQVRGYEVTYAENVTNGMVSVLELEGFGESTSVTTSGVVVRNPGRNIWTREVSKGRLAFDGRSAVRVGGVGWRETVVANRTGWSLVGSNASYRVTLVVDGNVTPVYASPPATAEPVVAGQNVSIAAEEEGFRLVVGPENDTVSAPVPRLNESVTLRGVEFTNRGGKLYATTNGTRVRVAAKERYQ